MRAMALFILALIGVSLAYTGGGGGSGCARITSSGTYAMTADAFGAPYDTGYSSMACIIVDSSDVVIDCAGHGMTGYGDAYGVYINNTASGSLNNVTVKNCAITNYQYGIYSWGTPPGVMDGCAITNNTLYNTYNDLVLVLAKGCTVEGNHFARSVNIQSVNDSSILDNVMEPIDYCYGMAIGALWTDGPLYNTNDSITGNTVRGCSGDGYDLEYLSGSYVAYNGAYENYESGFYVSESYNSTFYKNAARNNSLDDLYSAGFEFGGEGNILDSNIAENNSNGFDIFASDNTLTRNHAYNNYLGLTIESKSTGNTVENNTLDENVYVDMIVAGDARTLRFNSIGCANTIRNNTGSGGRPILFSNENGTILNGGTYSEVILCGAGESALDGVAVTGSDTLTNNGFMLVFSPNSNFTGLVSEDNAVGVWLYACDNCTVREGHAARNAVGYLVTYSRGVDVSDLGSFGNNASLANLFGDGKGMGFIAQMLSGQGIIEVTQMPRVVQGLESTTFGSTEPVYLYSGNSYSDIEVYGNNLGMTFLGTGNVTIDRADIHDNAVWGIGDMGGSADFPAATISSDSQLYRNGQDIFSILMSLGSGQVDQITVQRTTQETAFPELPEGILWGEYLQASMLYQMMLGGGYEVPAEWSMDSVRHGTGLPSVLLSADDGAESLYLTSETDLPTRDSFSYTQGSAYVTVNMDIAGPTSNKTVVDDKYFSIISLGESADDLCPTYCDSWGCDGQSPGCYYYDDLGYCTTCTDSNQNSVCDDFECIDEDQDGECDNKCVDEDENGMCDQCDVALPAIGNFSVAPGQHGAGHDMATLELYYLNITDIYQPELVGASVSMPRNRTFILEGVWLPVPAQAYEDGAIVVDPLEIPESPFLGGLLGMDDGSSGVYQGIYGLFAAPVAQHDDDEHETPKPEEPQQNGTSPECSTDDDCAVNEVCSGGACSRFPCACGSVQDHECVEYACCSDSQCVLGETCQNHACKAKESKYECTGDAQCAASSFCDIPAGAQGGTCEPVGALPCGEVLDHRFVAYGYECGAEAGCPSCPAGESCEAHNCIQSDVSCPTTGLVGDKKTCEAKQDGAACPNCDYVITAPNGWKYEGRTDDSGNFELPLDMRGTYQVALLKDGVAVRIIQVQAFPQAQPEGEEKPAATGPDASILAWVLALVVLAVGGVLYWRSMGRNGGRKGEPKK